MTSLKILSCDRFEVCGLEQFELVVKTLGELPHLEVAYLRGSSDDMANLRAYQLGQKKFTSKDLLKKKPLRVY